MPPKRRSKAGADSLFQYNNQVELTFKAQPKEKILEETTDVGDSDDDDANLPILRKKGKKSVDISSSSSDSSSASDSEPEKVDE